jgi:precorrin-2 dehydrogenase / sirohydrochlorin ferrochelatase
VVAISTGGRSPAMARRARQELERLIPPDWGQLLEVAAAARQKLGANRARVPAEAWQAALGETDLRRLVLAGQTEQAVEHLLERLEPAHG